MKNSRPVLLFLPTPPPYAGPEVASDLLLKALGRIPGASFIHVRSNVRSDNRQKGNFDLSGIVSFLKVYLRVLGVLIGRRPARICLLIASNRVGFLRDSVIILTARLLGCSPIAHYRGSNFRVFYQLCSPSGQRWIRFVLRRVEKVIVQARVLRNMFEGVFPLNAVYVLPNGLDFADWAPSASRDSEKVRILFVGHLSFAKGFYDLILAFDRIRKEHPNTELLFAGERMDQRADRHRIAEFLNSKHRAFFLDHLDEIEATVREFVENAASHSAGELGRISGREKQEVFDRAHIFVLPSYTEGFSMSVLEAMAHGLPVVTTRVGALPEVLQDGVNGFLVEPRQPEALQAALGTLVADAALRRTMGERNAKIARERYDIRRVAQDYWQILVHEPV